MAQVKTMTARSLPHQLGTIKDSVIEGTQGPNSEVEYFPRS